MTNDRIRLLYVTGDFKGFGTQHHLLQLVQRLDRRRFDITVATLSDAGELGPAMRDTGVRIERIPIRRPLWHPASLASIVRLSRRIDARFDLVHTLVGHSNVVGLLAARLAGHRRVLASQRGLHPVFGSFPAARRSLVRLNGWLFRHVAHRILVNNPAIVPALRKDGVPDENIVLIPNGIDLARFRPRTDRGRLRTAESIGSDASVVGFVGRMIPGKGLDRLLHAVEQLVDEHPRLEVLAAGDGPERQRLEETARHGALRGRVRFTGYRSDTEHLYPLMDLFAFPSTYSEGTPNALLEAMASGVPVVAGRMPQTEAILEDGRSGLFVDPRSTQALAAALARLLRDRELSTDLATQARNYVHRHHSLDDMIERIQQIYEDTAL